MAFEKVSWIWRKPIYFLIWLITSLGVGGIYAGLLTDSAQYGIIEWIFALAFPVLVGATVAVQVATYREERSCPINATGGGVLGTGLGVATVACASCPAILLSWIRSRCGHSRLLSGQSLVEAWESFSAFAVALLGQYGESEVGHGADGAS